MPDTRTLPRIVIVEDDAVVAETLTLYLEHAGFSVVTAADGREGLGLARQPGVALVVLDLMIPGVSGQQVCRALRETSRVPILMLTARTSEDDRVAGFEMGADDYVPKPFSPREVVARVQALLRRAGEPDANQADVLRAGSIEIDRWSRQVRNDGRLVTLTPTELRLLEALARHPGRTFTRDELVARAFGPDYDGLDRTIDTHITNLRRKLEPVTADRSGDERTPSAAAMMGGASAGEEKAGSSSNRQRCGIVTVHGVGYKLATTEDER
jgi:DNA-binding response OmpR family regulator